MNYTKSGIIACGTPHSAIRSRNEAQNAFDTIPQALLLTEEGIDQ
jgi:multisubunit Na+/H+ antiporter MnhC subunit